MMIIIVIIIIVSRACSGVAGAQICLHFFDDESG